MSVPPVPSKRRQDADDADDDKPRAAFSLMARADDDEHKDMAVAADRREPRARGVGHGGYRVYTTRYDREVRPATLVRQGTAARDTARRLDARIAAHGINVARLAHELKAALALPERDGWSFGEEHGRIDGRRLAQLVVRLPSGVCSGWSGIAVGRLRGRAS